MIDVACFDSQVACVIAFRYTFSLKQILTVHEMMDCSQSISSGENINLPFFFWLHIVTLLFELVAHFKQPVVRTRD